MAGQRRYKIGQFPMYDRQFDALKAHSAILAGQQGIPNVYSLNLADLQALKFHLYERIGDKDRKIWKNKLELPCLLKEAEDNIKAINKEFENIQQSARNAGRPIPKNRPKEMLHRLWKSEAREDIIKAEIETLERWIKDLESKTEEEAKEKVLQHGPLGIGRMRGGILYDVDGQRVKIDKKGILSINQPGSPYDGMLASDYFETIVKPWSAANAVLQKEYLEKVQKGLIEDTTARPPQAPWPDPPAKEKKAA
jgi:hypothetical protein